MKILNSSQYKIVKDYFNINENLDVSLKSLITDIEQLDLDGQTAALKKLQKFIYKQNKSVNLQKKKNKESVLYKKNESHIQKIKEALKTSPLKSIDKVFELKKSKIFKITRKYTNYFTGRSQNVIDSLIEDHDKILMDRIHFDYSVDFNDYSISIGITIEQYYNYKEDTHFALNIHMSAWNKIDYKEIPELKNIKKRMVPNQKKIYKLLTLEEVNSYLRIFKKEFENVEMYVDMKKYNL